jgi:hypothetical protein
MYKSSPREDSVDDVGPVTRLVFNPRTGTYDGPCAKTQKFIKGPIPFQWMASANALGGKAGAVGLALWFLRGVKRSSEVSITREAMQLAGCQRKALYTALDRLEKAGLIQQKKQSGKRTRVTLQA